MCVCVCGWVVLARVVPKHAVRILARVVPRHGIALGVCACVCVCVCVYVGACVCVCGWVCVWCVCVPPRVGGSGALWQPLARLDP